MLRSVSCRFRLVARLDHFRTGSNIRLEQRLLRLRLPGHPHARMQADGRRHRPEKETTPIEGGKLMALKVYCHDCGEPFDLNAKTALINLKAFLEGGADVRYKFMVRCWCPKCKAMQMQIVPAEISTSLKLQESFTKRITAVLKKLLANISGREMSLFGFGSSSAPAPPFARAVATILREDGCMARKDGSADPGTSKQG